MDTTTVIVGAGHAGLAMSRRLTERSTDHVVLERGEVANSWRTERWDSLRLLTPNWMNHLPGQWPVPGHDPDGFATVAELVTTLAAYATQIDAPVLTGTTVTGVRRAEGGYTVETDRGRWRCRSLVVASGACNVANVPPLAEAVPRGIHQVTPQTYRSPAALADGGVLVVGASATGVQLAEEIHRSGRPVTLSVGEHVRLPRTHRGRDIMRWLDASGVLDERWDQMDDLVRARHLPSPQLIGSPERRTIDLNHLQALGVRLVGRIGAVRDGIAHCSGGLANTIALADLKLTRLLRRIDDRANTAGVEPTAIPRTVPLSVNLNSGEFATIVWATGYRSDHRWLDPSMLDRRGMIAHRGGVVDGHPGLVVLGTSLLRTRRSNYIAGAAADTAALANHVAPPGTRRP